MLINSLKIEDKIIHIYTLIMIKNKLKILDCTLRDGGYYNNWEFPQEIVSTYLQSLESSHINYVEIGFRFLQKNSFFL